MTANELRLILADALDGAADRLRAGIDPNVVSVRTAEPPAARDPLVDVSEHVLRVDDVARLLGMSSWRIYKSVREGEIPAVRVGRRALVPTQQLREWLSASASRP
ncbi:MAG: helix-turn-helix domain-containing protein [Acidimicrobiales bacterium]